MVTKELPGQTPDYQVQSVIRVESGEFPTDPEARFAALLASLNSGPKATVMLLLPEYGHKSPSELNRDFKYLIAGSEMENVGLDTASTYCKTTLVPIGLVAAEHKIELGGIDKIVGYGATEAGRKYGRIVAAYELTFESQGNFSLYSVLGATNSPSEDGLRAPYVRAGILEILSRKTHPIREIELAEELGVDQSVISGALGALHRAGALSGKIKTEYELGDKGIDQMTVVREPALTDRIIRICQDFSTLGRAIDQEGILNRLFQDLKERWKVEILRRRISEIVLILVENKVLKKVKHEVGRGGSFSDIRITQRGREIMDYLTRIKRVASDDPEAFKDADEVLRRVNDNFQTYVSKSADFYYPHSTSYKKAESPANKARVMGLISQHSGITVPELVNATGLSRETIRTYIAEFEREKEVRVDRNTGVKRHYPRRRRLRSHSS